MESGALPLTGADGRFSIDAPTGRLAVGAFSMGLDRGGYGFARRIVTVTGGTVDIGDLRVPRDRVKKGEATGDLGFVLKQQGPDVDPEAARLIVAIVRPGGPAAAAGLRVGDVIVAIDGHDLRADPFLFMSLARVPPGTVLSLGLARGPTIALTTGPPR
jgi:S1-C subfamily serine protease